MRRPVDTKKGLAITFISTKASPDNQVQGLDHTCGSLLYHEDNQ